MNYWDEDYFERSEYDLLIEELKQKIKEDVNQEIKDKIASLEEDKKLLMQAQQENYDLKRKCEEIKYRYDKTEEEIRNMSLSKFVDLIASPLYGINNFAKPYRFKKCKKCDDHRWIHFLNPLGEDATCYCSCGKEFERYKIREKIGKELRNKEKGIIIFSKHDWEEYSTEWIPLNDDTKYIEDCDWEDKETRKAITFKKEVAEKYLDFLNDKSKKEAQEWADKYGLEIEE